MRWGRKSARPMLLEPRNRFAQFLFRLLYSQMYRLTGKTPLDWIINDSKTVCVDLDGVVAKTELPYDESTGWAEFYSNKSVMPGAREALQELLDNGWYVVLYTSRFHPQHKRFTMDWLSYHEVPFSEIVFNKPFASYYIDDNAVRFTGWETTMAHLDLLEASKG